MFVLSIDGQKTGSPTYLVDRCSGKLAKMFGEVQQTVEVVKRIECGKAKNWLGGQAQ